MLTNLLFPFAISSGSALAAVIWKKEYEDILPITIFGIISIQFLMGVVGFLEAGFFLTIGITATIWGVTIFLLIRNEDPKTAMHPFFSHGFWLFLFLYIALNLVLYGMNIHEWDEFSHWGTVVKAMVQTGGFGTVPQAHMLFGSYPPGMALFQYFVQKIYSTVGAGGFSEWRLYLAYIVLASSFLLPLIKRIRARSFQAKLVIMLVFILVPLPFYQNYYHSLYIDAFLGILSGAGLAMIVIASAKRDRCYFLYIFSICAILTLAKSSGVLLAVLIAAAYMADYKFQEEANWKEFWGKAVLFAVAIGIPELLWNFSVKVSGIPSEAPVVFHLKDFINILTGKDTTYRASAFKLFKTALFNNTATEGNSNFAIGDLGISISYFALLVIFFIVIYFLWYLHKKKASQKANSILIVAVVSVIGWLSFYMSLGVIYLFKFTESEALRLASYSRYTHTIYLSMYIVIVAVVLYTVLGLYSGKTVFVVILGVFFLVTPMEDFAKLLFRDIVRESIDSREPYLELAAKINTFTQPYDNVYFICQDERFWFSGLAYWQVSFAARPAVIDNLYDGWALFEESSSIYTSERSAPEWRRLLLDNYDYVALYQTDDYFYSTFSCLFTDPEDIRENCLYKVDKNSGLLELYR